MSDLGWLGVYVFSSMIVLADKDGIVNMDERSLFKQIGLDEPFGEHDAGELFPKFLEVVSKLCQADDFSNIEKHSGRRLIPLSEIEDIDENRGWFIVNYDYYRRKGSTDERNEYTRGYMAAMRKLTSKSSKINNVSNGKQELEKVSKVSYTDTDTDTNNINPPTPLKRGRVVRNEKYSPEFETFWQLYPKRVGKPKAYASFQKQNPKIEDLKKALAWQMKSEQWQKDGGQFIPHAATWINQRRWEDEPDVKLSQIALVQEPEEKCTICRNNTGLVYSAKHAGMVVAECKHGKLKKLSGSSARDIPS
jgi:hypothetical protein